MLFDYVQRRPIMTIKRTRQAILLFILGFVFLTLDYYINTGFDYPQAYANDKDIVGEYQYYAIKTFYGATCTYKLEGFVDTSDATDTTESSYTENSSDSPTAEDISGATFVDDVFFDNFRIDVFNDVAGLLLIAIACLMLSKYQSMFRLTFMLSFITIAIKAALTLLPFILNGMVLCNLALGVGISYMIATIITTFFGIRGFLALAHDTCCRDERIWINTCWFSSMVITILVLLFTWLDLIELRNFFTGINLLLILGIGLILKRVDEFITRNCTE